VKRTTKTVLSLIVALALSPILTEARPTDTINVDGLEAKTVDVSPNGTHIRFHNEYLNKSITYINVFLPSDLKDDLSYQKPCNPSRACQGQTPDPNNGETGLFHILNAPATNPGSSVFVQTEYKYRSDSTDTDDDVPKSLRGEKLGEQIRFNTNGENDGLNDILNTERQLVQGLNKTITVQTYYEKLVINYEYKDTDSNKTVAEYTDVFRGKTQKIPFRTADSETVIQGDTSYKDLTVEYDNTYGEEKTVDVVLLYEDDAQIKEKSLGTETNEVSKQYSSVKSTLIQNGIYQSILKDDTDGYNAKYYETTIREDTTEELRVRIQDSDGGRAYLYVIGSAGGVETVYGEGTIDSLVANTESLTRTTPRYTAKQVENGSTVKALNYSIVEGNTFQYTEQCFECSLPIHLKYTSGNASINLSKSFDSFFSPKEDDIEVTGVDIATNITEAEDGNYTFEWTNAENTSVVLEENESVLINYEGERTAKLGEYSADVVPRITDENTDLSLERLAWWNTSFTYRQNITISNHPNKDGYALKLKLNNNKVGSGFDWSRDGDDVRFTDSDGNVLNHWFAEDKKDNFQNQKGTAFVNTSTETQNIYMYYGNADANNAEDIQGTFLFGDDFNDGTLRPDLEIDCYSGNSCSPSPSESSGRLKTEISQRSPVFIEYDEYNGQWQDTIIKQRFKPDSDNINYIRQFGFSDKNCFESNNSCSTAQNAIRGQYGYTDGYQGHSLQVGKDGSFSSTGNGNDPVNNQYQNATITINSSEATSLFRGGTKTIASSDSNFPTSISPTNIFASWGSARSAGGRHYVDWVYVRDHTSNDVTTTFQSEERNNPLVVSEPVFDQPQYKVSSLKQNTQGSAHTTDDNIAQAEWYENGTTLFTIDNEGDLRKYTASDAYNASTITEDQTADLTSEDGFMASFHFVSNGDYLYAAGGGSIYQYNLTSSYDLTTLTYYDSASVDLFVNGVRARPNGEQLFAENSENTIEVLNLTSSYDISTAELTKTVFLDGRAYYPSFNDDGSKMFGTNRADTLFEYNLSTPYDPETAVLNDEKTLPSITDQPQGIFYSENGTQAVTADGFTQDIYTYKSTQFTDKTVAENIMFNYDFDATDPDNDTISWSKNGATFTSVNNTGYLNGTPGFSQSGNYTVSVKATDPFNAETTGTFNLEVTNTNQDPSMADLPNVTRRYNETLQKQIKGTDPDSGNTLTYSSNNTDIITTNTSGYILDNYTGSDVFTNGAPYSLNSQTKEATQSVLSNAESLNGIAFNNNGTKLYLGDNSDNAVRSYNLNTAYDASTATFNTEQSINIDGSRVYDVAWGSNGSTFYTAESTGAFSDGSVNQYNVSTPYDVTTISTSYDSYTTTSVGRNAIAIGWNDDGTKFYASGGDLTSYNTNTAYKFDGVTEQTTYGAGHSVYGFDWKDNGKKLVTINNNGEVREHTLSTPYDLSTASHNGNTLSTNGTEDVRWVNNGSNLYTHEYDNLYRYETGSFTASYDIKITTNDGDGGSTSDTFTLTMNNTAPSLDPISNQTTTDNETLTVQANASDPENQSLSYDINTSKGSINASGAWTWNPNKKTDVGRYTFAITTTDNKGLKDTETFGVEVERSNREPNITTETTTKTAFRDYTASIDFNATDPDGNDLTWTTNISNASINNSGYWTWAPTSTGEYPASVTVNDGNGGADSENFTVTVTAPQRLPSENRDNIEFEDVDNPSTTTRGQNITFTADVEDLDGDEAITKVELRYQDQSGKKSLPVSLDYQNELGVWTHTESYQETGSIENVTYSAYDTSGDVNNKESISIDIEPQSTGVSQTSTTTTTENDEWNTTPTTETEESLSDTTVDQIPVTNYEFEEQKITVELQGSQKVKEAVTPREKQLTLSPTATQETTFFQYKVNESKINKTRFNVTYEFTDGERQTTVTREWTAEDSFAPSRLATTEVVETPKICTDNAVNDKTCLEPQTITLQTLVVAFSFLITLQLLAYAINTRDL